MKDITIESKSSFAALKDEIIPLPGRLEYQTKDGGTYGIYIKNTYVNEGKVGHDRIYLGKVLDKEKGIFYRNRDGYFTFSTKEGFGNFENPLTATASVKARATSFHFGDMWMIDQVFKKTRMNEVLENTIPN
jgi:hypothetical protein